MAGKFSFKKFAEIDIEDPLFDELKLDYPGNEHSTGFEAWFARKVTEGATALIFYDEEGLGAFIAFKDENEPIELVSETLPAMLRLKISTLTLAPRYRGQRLGEGAMGLILWQWRHRKSQEIYVTIFEKHELLIRQLKRFGFCLRGKNLNGELVYMRSRASIDYTDPYKTFPFINPNFDHAGYLVVNDEYHDTLFPYSELKNTLQETVGLSVANGMSKIYIGSPTSPFPYEIGEPILIYRRYTGTVGKPGFKSCVTSFCVVTDIIVAKERGISRMSVEELLARIGNKSVFNDYDIRIKHRDENSLVIVEMLYCGYFGSGNNVNWVWLKDNGYMPEQYPTTVRLSPDGFKSILAEGGYDVSDVIID